MKYILMILAILCFATTLAVAYAAGVFVTNKQLPDCEEDEYLYPEDFTGRGDNVTSDYKCVHVDAI